MSKKYRRDVSTATSTVSASRTKARGLNIATHIVEVCSGSTSVGPPSGFDVGIGAVATLKWTTCSEPSASTSSTSARNVRSRWVVGLLGEVAHVLGPDADDDLLAVVGPQCRALVHQLRIDGQSLATDDDDDLIALDLDVGDGLVHRRRTHEAGDEQVVRIDVDLPRRARLLEDAAVDDRDAVAHRHRFDLVVGDVERRDTELLLELGDLGAHLPAELGVEVRQRLVHEERRRLAHDRSAHRHPLALAPGQHPRLAVEELGEPEDVGRVPDTRVDLLLVHLPQSQPEGDVLVDGQVRVQRVALEHHRDVALRVAVPR